MEYGGQFDPNHYVEVSFIRASHAIALRIKDPGPGFSIEELRHAAVSSPAGDLFSHVPVREEKGLRPGGFGLLMAKTGRRSHLQREGQRCFAYQVHQSASRTNRQP
jgi:anti-sigma regulatory factor (Ser/Thr protein kinase)